ncbi:MAG: Rieske (2Fe-2S) protein [Corynebacteriales bacterium]|nr:Rieske (2Fe-2S) protein [Mycobacteriales bacterium]
MSALNRRQMVCGIAGAGLIATALAACSDSDDDSSSDDATATPTPSSGAKLAQTVDVPEGGGIIVMSAEGAPIVIVQPTAGQYKAFSAKCTHQGTTVDPPKDGIMTCPNHGSQFSLAGAVERGPATTPLPAVAVKVEGSDIVAG